MVKSIIREVIIMLLLLIAIILALGVLFYDYIPANKQVPSIASYTTSEEIQAELEEEITEEETVLVTYEITASDLKTYEKTSDYTKGKVNPFSTYETETSDENNVTNTSETNSTNTNTSSSTNSSTTSNTTSNTSSNTYYNSTGTK